MYSEITSLSDLEIIFFPEDLLALEKGEWIESIIEDEREYGDEPIGMEKRRLLRMKIDPKPLYPIEIKQRAYHQLSLKLFEPSSLFYTSDEIEGLVGVLGYDIYLSPDELKRGIEEDALLGGRGIQFGLHMIDRIHLMYESLDGRKISKIKNQLVNNPQLREYFPYKE